MTDDDSPLDQPTAPNMRSFRLNSTEGHAALCRPSEYSWLPNCALPRDPRPRDIPVVVDHDWTGPRARIARDKRPILG